MGIHSLGHYMVCRWIHIQGKYTIVACLVDQRPWTRSNRLGFPTWQSEAAPGPPHGAPIVANAIEQSGYAYTERIVAHYAPSYYTSQQQYVSPPTYLNHNAPYSHKPFNIIDWSRQEGRYSNAWPNEPHSPSSGGLPPGAMEKIRKDMVELFRDRLGVSVARVGQSLEAIWSSVWKW